MPSNHELIERAKRVQLQNYRPAPFVLTRGEGRRLFDVEGKSYLDFAAGIAVVSVGHGHPRLAKAIAEQAARLMHTSNLFYNDRGIELAERVTKRTGVFSRAFLCNSGAEANEAMLKLSRRYHFDRGDKERVEIIACEKSFHGRTYGALSVTGQPKYHEGMAPLLPGIHIVPFGDLDAMRKVVGKRTAAVLVEPVQGEGGIVVGSADYLRGLRELCTERGALLLFDEVQTCYARTGPFLAREHTGVIPDLCSLAKGIGGGFPLGAMLATEAFANALPPGSHATTFGGNPLAAAAALAVLDIFDEENLVEHAKQVGSYLGDRLGSLTDLAAVNEARGLGLLRGVELAADVDPTATLAAARDRALLLSLAGGNVLRFSPPITVTRAEIDEAIEIARRVLESAPKKA